MEKVKKFFKVSTSIVIFLCVGVFVPYVIQFELKMFGANMITLSDIVKLWAVCFLFGAMFSSISFLWLSEK